MRKLMLLVAGAFLLVPIGGATAVNPRNGCETETGRAVQGGCVADVSGLWQGTFSGQVFSGQVTLMITQDHRRFMWTAFASNGMLATGDGTIANGPKGDVNAQIMGSGPLLKKIDAHGMVMVSEGMAVSAMFVFDAIYMDGTHDMGAVELVHVIRGGGD